MRRAVFLMAALAVAALAISVYVQKDGATNAAPVEAGEGGGKAVLRKVDGTELVEVGVAKLNKEDGRVFVRVKVHDLPPGFHGFHVHETGTCTPPGFTSAGFHFDPSVPSGVGGGTPHPNEAGDLPVLLVNADGTGEARFKTDRFAVADLFDADGSALIIHVSPDNYANIPARYRGSPPAATPTAVDQATLNTGDAGGRIACGVVVVGD